MEGMASPERFDPHHDVEEAAAARGTHESLGEGVGDGVRE